MKYFAHYPHENCGARFEVPLKFVNKAMHCPHCARAVQFSSQFLARGSNPLGSAIRWLQIGGWGASPIKNQGCELASSPGH